MIRIVALGLFICFWNLSVSYGQVTDSIPSGELQPVEITAYFSRQPVLGLTVAGQTVSAREIEKQQTTTLLPALNSISGVRMEERSPGSYRLAIRGSMIRSPFGVRNVKIYMDEFSFTDAGGNTYLNLIDPSSIASIQVLKGPDGSLWGANSGGVIHLQPKGFNMLQNGNELTLSGGSYGLFRQQLSVQRQITERYSFSFDQSMTRSDGYRENSALNKKTFQTAHKWRYYKNNELRFLALYTDLQYQTPGGLTKSQFDENPRMARPAAGPNPSATEQQAGIYNNTFFGGIAHEAKLSNHLTHTLSVFGSYTDFENPFITNYEYRIEKNIGMRTYLSYSDTLRAQIPWQMQLGYEGQTGRNRIDNYDNNGGVAGDVQAKDELDNTQQSFFYRGMMLLYDRWRMEASVGINKAKIDYQTYFPESAQSEGLIDFGTVLMFRFATSYTFLNNFALRASVSKGYSPPTIAEVRSSDNHVNTDLEAETGINYELGFRMEFLNRSYIADVSFYHYVMDNGIVRRLRENGAEYYVNAGEMNQNGIEITIHALLLPYNSNRFVQRLSIQSAASYHHYRFGNYHVNDNDYSNNKITAVPDWILNTIISLNLPQQIEFTISHNYTSSLPLNDSNTVFADAFHLVQLKGSWERTFAPFELFQLFIGVDNLLNEKYSLGNDINAFGDRFYNPAPEINIYAGIKLGF